MGLMDISFGFYTVCTGLINARLKSTKYNGHACHRPLQSLTCAQTLNVLRLWVPLTGNRMCLWACAISVIPV